ncbi:ribose-phosphate pyrophosphokinase [Sphaerisporangium melleum]|uniref:ribose-phosphate diphosphokinase n=1 Tax=Sphaerisporangium melleum TaxID=321316 RepID=A0A917RM62_9ACTN|nr:ribose-phosphate pyrophosphokinase [Sphaerisporangium melleum]GGL13457.1 ribose-phosphate pyrophosphokinase [Sphaerisporangium melleum]GII74502.1 ribose-phosphate pyrophosphokinase [Sphaerisporangium melleum]
MTLRIAVGTAGPALGRAVAAGLYTEPAVTSVERFPDGELRPVVHGVRGADVYLVQPTGPPVNEHVMELLLLLDACRRGGAARLTAVVPYFGYARQDRRGRAGEAIGIRVVADALASAGARRLIVVDPHTAALEAVCAMPVEMLTAVPVLAAALGERTVDDAVVVAPDLGAVKLAERYAALLSRPVAVVRKTRLSGTRVSAEELVGDVRGRQAVVVDDMISTGGTIEAAVHVLLENGAIPPVLVAATHGLFVPPAAERLGGPRIAALLVTDSLPQDAPTTLPIRVCPSAPLLADAIGRLHRDESLDDLLFRT